MAEVEAESRDGRAEIEKKSGLSRYGWPSQTRSWDIARQTRVIDILIAGRVINSVFEI